MFDIDQAITDWRRQLARSGINSPDVLDELESHLRDDLQQLSDSASEAQCFLDAVERLGQTGLLKTEFAKVGGWKELQTRIQEAFLTLAGIPALAANMNTTQPQPEPRWATYLKASAFLLPAVLLWTLSVIFVVPKLKQICAHAGGVPLPGMLQGMLSVSDHAMWLVLAVVLSLAALEWRSTTWQRYRRAAIGVGTFVLNSVVLIAIFLMVISALLAAPALMQSAK
jgi:hypothetical protein